MTKYTVKDFDRNSFPSLYRCADDASTSGQKWYSRWLGINLCLLVVTAFVGSFNFSDPANKQIAYSIIAVMFFMASGTTILLAAKRWERIWYAGRAVAESAKSLTWKFVCGADPFPADLDEGEAVSHFCSSLHELLTENKQLTSHFSQTGSGNSDVTPRMLSIRASATEVKRDIYLSQRVSEQQAWYARKSTLNRTHRTTWFALLITFQTIAGLASVFIAIHPTFSWKAAAVFGALASATVAWGQLKRYQELAQAYSLAAQELLLISARGYYVETAADLARFVNDAETAISREHSMWVARRETK